tara:strand:+ start:1539 stop:1643 length:105 start_codon:yes stop_codon:yes gene_type:complete
MPKGKGYGTKSKKPMKKRKKVTAKKTWGGRYPRK